MLQEKALKELNRASAHLKINLLLPLVEKHGKRMIKLQKQFGDDINSISKDKVLEQLNYKQNIIEKRLGCNHEALDYLIRLRFTHSIPEEIKPLLSPFGTFCDRTNFYYNSDLLEKSDEELSYIIFCEFFNAFQDYYSSGRLSKGLAVEIRANSLLMMYHIGIIKDKLWYGQSTRMTLTDKAITTYPNNKFVSYSFEPNVNACKYLYNKMINDKDYLLGDVEEKATTLNIKELRIQPKGYRILSELIIRFDTLYKGRRAFIDLNEDRKLTKRNKIVKEHIELTKLADKLSQ